MMKLPIGILNLMGRLGVWKRPQFLCTDVTNEPEAISSDIILREVRGGYAKWAYLKCPKCGDLISLPIAGRGGWNLTVDWMHRPTLAPSIWEKSTCGAHFFVRGGRIEWCREARARRRNATSSE